MTTVSSVPAGVTADPSSSTPWWGPAQVPLGHFARWRIGRFTAWASNLHQEWRLAYANNPADDETTVSLQPARPLPHDEPPDATIVRLGESSDDPRLVILPATADRIVVSRPHNPFRVAPRDAVVIYASTPIWFQIRTAFPERQLLDVPVYRLSDTWLGSNTIDGQAAYATRTSARLRLEDLPSRPGRVSTAIRLTNQTDEAFLVERLALPLPNLAIYVTHDGRLWTQNVHLERDVNNPMARCIIADGAEGLPPGAIRVAEPRTTTHGNFLIRAFANILR